jgi:SAM-dependent methyltransferase
MSASKSLDIATAAEAFDGLAASYDNVFTYSAIGQAQRGQVWRRLLHAFAPGQCILEINCGTGEDARFLASHGRSIVACDASNEMIEVASLRTRRGVESAELIFHQLANEDLASLPRRILFDGAFSNFSGLNCVDDLHSVAMGLAALIKPGGKLLLCLWNKICPTEIVWYLLHGRLGKALRRLSGNSKARIGERTISVLYPSARALRCAFAPWFDLERHRAVGLFVPPSYFEHWAADHPKSMKRLDQLDRVFASYPILRNLGDHVLLEFTRCTP